MDTESCRLKVRSFTLPIKSVRAFLIESPWLGRFQAARYVREAGGRIVAVKYERKPD